MDYHRRSAEQVLCLLIECKGIRVARQGTKPSYKHINLYEGFVPWRVDSFALNFGKYSLSLSSSFDLVKIQILGYLIDKKLNILGCSCVTFVTLIEKIQLLGDF